MGKPVEPITDKFISPFEKLDPRVITFNLFSQTGPRGAQTHLHITYRFQTAPINANIDNGFGHGFEGAGQNGLDALQRAAWIVLLR